MLSLSRILPLRKVPVLLSARVGKATFSSVVTIKPRQRIPSSTSSPALGSAFTTSLRWFSDKPPPVEPVKTTVRVTVSNKEVKPSRSKDNDIDASQFTVPIEVKMPELGYEHYKGTIEKWYKKPGDIIRRDDILCDIQTPDFTFGMSMDDTCDAIMGDIVVEAGESTEDLSLICTVWHPHEEGDENQQEKKE